MLALEITHVLAELCYALARSTRTATYEKTEETGDDGEDQDCRSPAS
jgi:hypothetical protein